MQGYVAIIKKENTKCSRELKHVCQTILFVACNVPMLLLFNIAMGMMIVTIKHPVVVIVKVMIMKVAMTVEVKVKVKVKTKAKAKANVRMKMRAMTTMITTMTTKENQKTRI